MSSLTFQRRGEGILFVATESTGRVNANRSKETPREKGRRREAPLVLCRVLPPVWGGGTMSCAKKRGRILWGGAMMGSTHNGDSAVEGEVGLVSYVGRGRGKETLLRD